MNTVLTGKMYYKFTLEDLIHAHHHTSIQASLFCQYYLDEISSSTISSKLGTGTEASGSSSSGNSNNHQILN